MANKIHSLLLSLTLLSSGAAHAYDDYDDHEYDYYSGSGPVYYGQLEVGIGFDGTTGFGLNFAHYDEDDALGFYGEVGSTSGDLAGTYFGAGIVLMPMGVTLGLGQISYDYEDCSLSWIDGQCEQNLDARGNYFQASMILVDDYDDSVYSFGVKLLPEDVMLLTLGFGFVF